MSIKEKNRHSRISKTLLLPLYFRALENLRPDAILKDDIAERIVDEIGYDFSPLDSESVVQTATILRIREFDNILLRFMEKNPDGVVINIGCGLDTRFYRLDNGRIKWYDLDLPEVIGLRRHFLEETERCRFIASDVLDFEWIDAVPERVSHPVLFIAEGVFLYFTERSVRQVVVALRKSFSGARLAFDAVSPLQCWTSLLNPALHIMDTRFSWGLPCGRLLEQWADDIRFIRQSFYFDRPMARLGWFNLWNMMPQVSRGFSILEYVLGEEKS